MIKKTIAESFPKFCEHIFQRNFYFIVFIKKFIMKFKELFQKVIKGNDFYSILLINITRALVFIDRRENFIKEVKKQF